MLNSLLTPNIIAYSVGKHWQHLWNTWHRMVRTHGMPWFRLEVSSCFSHIRNWTERLLFCTQKLWSFSPSKNDLMSKYRVHRSIIIPVDRLQNQTSFRKYKTPLCRLSWNFTPKLRRYLKKVYTNIKVNLRFTTLKAK